MARYNATPQDKALRGHGSGFAVLLACLLFLGILGALVYGAIRLDVLISALLMDRRAWSVE